MEGQGSSNGGQTASAAKAAILNKLPFSAKVAIIAGVVIFASIIILFNVIFMALFGADNDGFDGAFGADTGNNNSSSCASAGSCVYDIKGFFIASKGDVQKPMNITDLKVRLMQAGQVGSNSCGGTYGEPIEGEELVPFEKYILGVVYAEMGDVSGKMEARKAQAVAARSYILARATDMGSSHGNKLEQENGQWILQVTNCVSDQVYCDPDKGCSKKVAQNNQWGNVYTGVDNPITYKGPLSQTSELRTAVAETGGRVLLNAQGNVIYAGFVQSDQNAFDSLGSAGKDYTEILIEHYNSGARPYGATSIAQGKCNTDGKSTSCGTGTGNSSGAFRTWKQLTSLGAPWGNVSMGSSNINTIGCLATSIAIQIANSGIDTGMADFNPGTFVEACTSKGVINGAGLIRQDRVNEIVPGFTMVYGKDIYSMSQAEKADAAKKMLDDGCYPVMEVKGVGRCPGCGQHWVAVDKVEDGKVYMMDPATVANEVFSIYGNKASMLNCYKKT